MGEADRISGDVRRLRRGLGDDRVAGDQRRRHLAEEDGEREIPRRAAYEDPAAFHPEHVALAGRSRQLHRHEAGARLIGIITAEIRRLAHLGERVGDRLLRLLHADPHQHVAIALERVGEAIETRGAILDGPGGPGAKARQGPRHGLPGPLGLVRPERRRGALGASGFGGGEVQGLRYDRRDPLELGLVVEIDAGAVAAHRAEQVARQRDRGVARAADRFDLRHRIGEQLFVGQVFVGELVDEGRVRAIFEEAADEIGEQIAMAADRRVDAAAIALLAHQILIEAVAHAVQPLEFEIAAVARPFEQGRDGQRIVGREGGIDVLRRQHVLRAGEIGDIGRRLAGEEGVIGEALFLGALDLRVPIGALDEPGGDPPAGPGADRIGPGDGRPGALAIGLDRHAEPVPALQRRQPGHRLDDVEAHFEPLGLLRIDGDGNIEASGEHRQRLDLLDQRGNAAIILRDLVARMEGGELDRDAVPLRRGGADRPDRRFIGIEIAIRVGEGARRLAQHVEAGGEALVLALSHPRDRLVDGPAHDENFAHHPHRRADALTHERLASARYQALEHARLLAVAGQRAADDEAPGRRIDERGIGPALVRPPVAAAELVGDQAVGGLGIGDPKERLGERQQGDALRSVQPIFLEELVDPPLRLGGAKLGKHGERASFHAAARIGVERGGRQQRLQHLRLARAVQPSQLVSRGCRSVRHARSPKGLFHAAARPYAGRG